MDGPAGETMLPADSGAILRRRFGLEPSERPRLAFAHGFGDVEGTWRHWCAGRPDPRVPVATYSGMFFDLVAATGSEALVITNRPLEGPARKSETVVFSHLPAPTHRGPLDHWRSALRGTWAMRRTLSTFAPHVVVMSSFWPPVFWTAPGPRPLTILSMHNTFWPMGAGRSRRLPDRVRLALAARWSRRLDAAVCTSHECARQLAALAAPRRIPTSVETPRMLDDHPVNPRPARVRELLFLGRIERAKGVFLLIDAVVSLLRDGLDVSLTLAGSGSAEGALRERLAALQDPRIRFVGRLSAEGVHAQLARTDLLVCPTMTAFNEGLALVCFEAAAHGVPSVASTVVPARETLAACTIPFEADDGAALAVAIRRAVEEPGLYDRLRAGAASSRVKLHDVRLCWGAQLFAAMAGGEGVS